MIEATQAIKKKDEDAIAEARAASLARIEEERAAARRAAERANAKDTQNAERQGQVSATNAAFDVHLDGETLRLYSELRDPETDRVIVRIPVGYTPSEERDQTPLIEKTA